jgi:hypothetical protein
MPLRLKDGTKLVFARKQDPGRLVRRGVRFVLDRVEEKIAAVLIDGASEEELTSLLSQPNVGWDKKALIRFVKKMRKAELLEEDEEAEDEERYDDSAKTELMLAEDLPKAIEPPGTDSQAKEQAPTSSEEAPATSEKEQLEDAGGKRRITEDTLTESTEQVTKVETTGRRLSQELETIATGTADGTEQVIHGMPRRKKIKAPPLKLSKRRRPQRGHRSSLLVAAVFLLLLVNGALALHLIEVPRPTRLACRLAGVPLARALTPINGMIISTRASGGQYVAKGAALALVQDKLRASRLAALDRRLAREKANLRALSRPCSRKRLKWLARRLKTRRLQRARQARRCRPSTCARRLAGINKALGAAGTAFEICRLRKNSPQARAARLRRDRLRAERGALVFKPVQALISSPAAGLACEILPQGRPLSWGSPVATICDPRRLWATARYSGEAPTAGSPARVLLGSGAAALEGKTEATAAGEIRVSFPGDAARYLRAARDRCELKLELGTMPLWRSWIDGG